MIISIIYSEIQILIIVNFILSHSHFFINKLKMKVSCLLFIHHVTAVFLFHQQLSDSDRTNINKHTWNISHFNFNVIFKENSKLISLSISRSENFSRIIICKVNFNSKIMLQNSKFSSHFQYFDDILICFWLNNICLLSQTVFRIRMRIWSIY